VHFIEGNDDRMGNIWTSDQCNFLRIYLTFGSSKLDALLAMDTEELLEKVQLTEDELAAGPDPNTTYYYKDSNDNWVEVTGLSVFDPNKTYYMTKLDRLLNDYNKDLKVQIEQQRTIEKSSDLYSELVTYAEAMSEFNIDNDRAKESLLLDMVNNYDYLPSFDLPTYMYLKVENTDHSIPSRTTQYYTRDENGVYHLCTKPLEAFEPGVTYYTYMVIGAETNDQERFLARIAYTAMIRRLDVNTNLDRHDGTVTTQDEVGTPSWNARNNHITDDFLNSDESYTNYTL